MRNIAKPNLLSMRQPVGGRIPPGTRPNSQIANALEQNGRRKQLSDAIERATSELEASGASKKDIITVKSVVLGLASLTGLTVIFEFSIVALL